MEKIIRGKAFVLGDNIDTDQIIPAEHLVYSLSDPEEKKLYGKYSLSGVPPEEAGLPKGKIPFVTEDKHESEFNIIVGGKNFGCGSSREHAPFSLQVAGAEAILAESYARIFYRNSVDGGFVIPLEVVDKINDKVETHDELEINFEESYVKNITKNEEYKINEVGDVLPIIEAGGLFKYSAKNLIKEENESV